MAKAIVGAFLEYQVRFEGCEMRGYDTWPEARKDLLDVLYVRFRPFTITCVKYLANGQVKDLWKMKWVDPSLCATREDKRYLRRIGADCAIDLFKWSAA